MSESSSSGATNTTDIKDRPIRARLAGLQRIVVKIGTNTLVRDGRLDTGYIADIAEQTAALRADRREMLLVSSGAIGMGARALGLEALPTTVEMRQACAAVGQPLLMHEYYHAFCSLNVQCAQVLVTRDVFDDRRSFLNLQTAVERLIVLGIVPILNENDSVSTEEIGSAFGDNDTLSALVASKIDAELLVMLTDIDGFYSAPPGSPGATLISVVEKLDDEHFAAAGTSISGLGRGGMRTKLGAVTIAADAGCSVVVANGREPGVLARILAGEDLGTLFQAGERLKSRLRWIRNSRAHGTIHVDAGAVVALRNKKSLLPLGITSVEGSFDAGAVVFLNDVAKLVTGFSAEELRDIAGRHSSEIAARVGGGRRDVVARPEDIVFL